MGTTEDAPLGSSSIDAGQWSEDETYPLPAGQGDRSRELANFLRNRRRRISPEQVGFPAGTNRRGPGLRREEVAVLAGVSPTWYAYLEQGRKIRPSPEVLDSLARALQLTNDERRYIHRLALGHLPAEAGPSLPPMRADLLWRLMGSLGDGPDPILIGNQYADVVAWNRAATDWFTDFSRYPTERRNMLWWMLTAPEARERVVNWAEDTRDVVARLRAAYALRPFDPKFQDVVEYLGEASREFREWWNDYDVREQRARSRTLRRPGRPPKAFDIMVLRLTDDNFNSALVHVPVAPPEHE